MKDVPLGSMERDCPALCEWVRYGTAISTRLRMDLLKAPARHRDCPEGGAAYNNDFTVMVATRNGPPGPQTAHAANLREALDRAKGGPLQEWFVAEPEIERPS